MLEVVEFAVIYNKLVAIEMPLNDSNVLRTHHGKYDDLNMSKRPRPH